jgi:hypothetical protein
MAHMHQASHLAAQSVKCTSRHQCQDNSLVDQVIATLQVVVGLNLLGAH